MERKKKLLILINSLDFFCTHRLPIAEAALTKGYDVVIGYSEAGGTDPELLRQKGFIVKVVSMYAGTNPLKDLKTFYTLWSFFKKEKPDIVHLITIKPYLYGGIISRLTGVPSIVSAISGLGTLFIHKNIKSKLLRLLLYPIYRLAFNHSNQKVIVQNEDDAKLLVRWGVLNLYKIRLIKGSGVDLENFKNLKESDGIPVISFAARLLTDKGVYEFVSAAKILNDREVQARFCLAGDLDLNNPSSLDVRELNILKNKSYIEVLGFQKDIASLYSRSHIICLPSYREGLPKTLIEAAAASRAVVTTDVPGCRDAIIPNKTGLLVPLKNSKKLADALQWLIEHPKERICMGKAGRKFAEKEFQIEKIVKNHLDIYQDLLSKTL